MTRELAAETLAQRLFAAESAIDHAVRLVAELAAALPLARANALLSATTGQAAFESTAASLAALTQGRARLVETHRTLAALARRMGLDPVSVGVVDKPEDKPPVGGIDPSEHESATLNKILPFAS